MQTYCIYKVTNRINGKIYIGCTGHFWDRVSAHKMCREEDDCIFHRAIQKYGFDNFEWKIIDRASTRPEILKLEKKYIEMYDSFHNGYNMTKGGDGGSMWNAKPIVCLTLDGEYVTTYDCAKDAERKGGFNNANVLMCCKGQLQTCKNHQFMYKEDYDEFGGKKYLKQRYGLKPIIQCDRQGNFIKKFDSVVDASKETGFNRAGISSNLIKKRKTVNGYIFVYENDYPIKDLEWYQFRKKGIPIQQLDINTNEVIAEYDRIADAGRVLEVNYKSIHKVLDKPDRSAYGYRWITKSC